MALTANLYIETALRSERTILKKYFCNAPFKIADITEDKNQNKLRIMLMSSSPGILDGDEFTLEIEVADGCCLELQTQSYQRLFQMKRGARQFFNVRMKPGSSFVYIPHPLVPHEKSIFLSKNKIMMDESCSLLWGEIMSCGRNLRGEIFQFSSYQSTTEIFFGEKLVVKENIWVNPAEIDLKAIGQLEGFTHQASLLFIDKVKDIKNKAESVIGLLQQQQYVEFGVSSLPVNGMIVRLLGYKAEQLFDILKNISCLLSQTKMKEGNYVS